MQKPLPGWAELPIDINQAALTLGISKRMLIDTLKNPEVQAGAHFELRGSKKVFYRENILALRKVMTQCASRSQQGSAKVATTTLTATTLKAKESDTLLRLRTLAAHKS